MEQRGGSPPLLPFLGFGSAEELERVAAALPDAVFTTDLEGRITSWNPVAERITGWRREEALGQRCSLLAGNALTGCACGRGPLRCDLATAGRSSRCCTIRTRDGRAQLILKNAVALYDPEGRPIGALEAFNALDLSRIGGAEPGAEPGPDDFQGLVGRDPVMHELFRSISVVARSDATVIILGESGTGKERVAEAIHRLSARADRPFVRVNCAALNENLLESELFGHVRGAFTGAVRDRRGRFEEADGGTLLLDEIGDVSPAVQVKLLRVIEARSLERVGDSAPRPVDVRLLCATHRDLKAMVADGRFRADLYFRLAVFPLRVPPLRDHLSDLERLALRLLREAQDTRGVPCAGLSPAALACLAAHSWPGNVRELRNVLESAALQAHGHELEPEHLPEELRVAGPVPSARPLRLTDAQPAACSGADGPEAMRAVLEQHGWNREAAARALGISRVTLWKRLKAHGLEGPPARAARGRGRGG